MPEAAAKPAHSLRRRLLWGVLLVTLLVWSLAGIFSYMRAAYEAEELLDGHLDQTAHLLLALVQDNDNHLDDLARRLATVLRNHNNIYKAPPEYQIGRGDGSVLLRSAGAPALPFAAAPGYDDFDGAGDYNWRMLNMVSADGRYRVQVMQSMALRDRVALEVAGQTIFPVVVALPLLLLFIVQLVRQVLRPLDRLADDIAARTPEALSPLPDDGLPREVAPLVATLNRLFGRLGQTLENERRFTADAAHELRTPLAALKVQTQVALLSEDRASRQHALRQIERGVDRATRLVNQLLRLARLDPLRCLEQREAVDLGHVVGQALGALQPPPGQRLTVDGMTPPPLIEGNADLLTLALGNLIDNAIRYGKADGLIRIAARCTDEHCDLSVSDDGPGIPPALVARLGERFFRNPDSGVEGNGLGLSIVRRIAELHGARLITANAPEGGFIATLAGLPRLSKNRLK
ncbi:MAG: sensor histidine kinase N-terminal domain-containing protein [Azonexus sp.]|jgi:two-component system sensor histidine kinase QseC|nr:sensor histidine kinase N-terminal domain-containing protein [Azonexus sp.]